MCFTCVGSSYVFIGVLLFCRTEFVVTASCDGHIKFWKKQPESIEFVKHFRSHLAPILDVAANANGTLLLSCGADKALKIFDVVNFGKVLVCLS